MRNETFKTIGFWGSFVAVILTVINIIMCVVKSVDLFKSGEGNDFMYILDNTAEIGFSTVLYKVAVAVLLVSLAMMVISYLVNTDGALKIFMILIKLIQLGSIITAVMAYFVLQSKSVLEMALLVIAVFEMIAFILFLIDSDHRKCAVKVAVHTLVTVGGGVLFMILGYIAIGALAIVVAIFIIKLFKDPGHRYTYRDSRGNVLSYWITQDY